MYDSKNSYGSISKLLHWIVALGIISLLSAGFFMTSLEASPSKWQIYGLHKASGITIIFLALIRIIWRLIQKKPNFPEDYPKWQAVAANIVHGLLYLLTIAMPLSGWVMSMAANHIPSWFGLFKLRLPIAPSKSLASSANSIHEFLAWLIIALLVLHLGAAIMHKNILKRMLPNCNQK